MHPRSSYPLPSSDAATTPSLSEGTTISPLPQAVPIPPHVSPILPACGLPGRALVSGYLRTSHVIPAASPRSLPPDASIRKLAVTDQRHKDPLDVANALVNAKIAFETEEMQKKYKQKSRAVLWNVVDRYVRQEPPIDPRKPGLILFVTHATGSVRQIWEPALAELFAQHKEYSQVVIDEVWSFESVQHGDSALINDQYLCDIFDWHDHCRDILNFLRFYLPSTVHIGSLPTRLELIGSRSETRRVVGIGHSYGGTTLARAVIADPGPFAQLILVEPMIVPSSFKRGKGLEMLLRSSLSKPGSWPSRSLAREFFLKYPPMKSWRPDVVDIFLEHGLTNNDRPEAASDKPARENIAIRLKTRPIDEAIVYCEWTVCYETWAGLPHIDLRIPLHWIMSGKNALTTGGEKMTQQTVWRRKHNTTNVRLPQAGHLIVQEAPKELAAEIALFLGSHGNVTSDHKL